MADNKCVSKDEWFLASKETPKPNKTVLAYCPSLPDPCLAEYDSTKCEWRVYVNSMAVTDCPVRYWTELPTPPTAVPYSCKFFSASMARNLTRKAESKEFDNEETENFYHTVAAISIATAKGDMSVDLYSDFVSDKLEKMLKDAGYTVTRMNFADGCDVTAISWEES